MAPIIDTGGRVVENNVNNIWVDAEYFECNIAEPDERMRKP
jgi:hypothetical protein